MKLYGLPESFWIVVQPTPDSTLADVCFACDFKRFINQVRGGLTFDEIVAIFAEQDQAVELAESLLAASDGRSDEEQINTRKP